MPTPLQYMQFSLGVYASSLKNSMPSPAGWSPRSAWQPDQPSGFSAGYYFNSLTNEVVISYTGTNDIVDKVNWGIGLGAPLPQIFEAVDYYFARKADHPTANITFTGHSLGGGLASLMAVYFDKQATVFDEAPFQLAAVNPLVTEAVSVYMLGKGYWDSAFAEYFLSIGALALTRETNVTNYYLEGEVLDYPRFSFDTLVGSEYVFAMGASTATPVERHSMALMTAMQNSNAFQAVVNQLPNLVTLLLDKDLYAADALDETKEDLLRKLLRHQAGISDGALPGGLLNRFTTDMQQLVGTMGLAQTDASMRDALMIASMEYFHTKAAASATQLFTLTDYGLHFKYSDIGASGYKSLSKLAAAVHAYLMPEELALLNGKLVKQDAWHIQSGAGGLTFNATGTDNDAVIGGAISDGIFAGAGNDIVIGGAGNDAISGGAGNDFLLGGIGNDTYILNAGDGYDTVLDSDGSGVIVFDTIQAKGSAGVASDKWYQLDADNWIDTQNDITYSRSVVGTETQLLIHKGTSNVLVKGWAEGELGIVLGISTPSITAPAAGTDIYATRLGEYYGTEAADRFIGTGPDAGWNIFYARGGDDQIHVDGLVADPLALALAEDGVNDQIYSPTLVQNTAYGEAGNDLLLGGREFDRLYGGSGDDILIGADGGDLLVGDADGAAADDGADILYGGDGDDSIYGGGGDDLIFAGTGDDGVIGNAWGQTPWPTATAMIIWAKG